MKRHPEQDGRCKTFWHIVSEGWDESSRTINQARLDRVCWARHLIDEYCLVAAGGSSTRIVWWKNVRRGESRVIIALADFSYIVVVAEREGYVLLWTAYPVERTHKRKKLRAEHDAYWQ